MNKFIIQPQDLDLFLKVMKCPCTVEYSHLHDGFIVTVPDTAEARTQAARIIDVRKRIKVYVD